MKVLVVYGTRPEAIKMAPLAKALQNESSIQSKVCVTGQHRQMLDQVNSVFGIEPEYDLNVMEPNQTLNGLSSKIFIALDKVIEQENPDWVLVHGDTTSAMVASLCAFHRQIRVGHVEAGLRTNDLSRPWPEELNRQVIDVFADKMFAPTIKAANNITKSDNREVIVTGNTVIDALLWVQNRFLIDSNLVNHAESQLPKLDKSKKTILVTGHRRENFGGGFLNICESLSNLADRSDVQILYPVHLNPNVQEPVNSILGNKHNIHLVKPLDYIPFIYAMKQSCIILTDSGGVQEEAPSLGKPVLVMRDVTERPEAVDAGTVQLVGTDAAAIYSATTRLLDDHEFYAKFSRAHNPYGDGKAVERIIKSLKGEYVDQFLMGTDLI